ncbi:hypothetical protein A7K91_20780 [Paenibacillus oryzae]|uniref:ABC transporter domain-containing protein n=1 Tax=Paenibacillus oryzae TaxID=1844972 RepID=A0A1A5YKT8_9BACL|nr:ABC transporter ATP-binding protein [Paenibacillus oryzae]OBR66173.1 hypothetical protein A7K91_20780 [Paenibacillus oryzae]
MIQDKYGIRYWVKLLFGGNKKTTVILLVMLAIFPLLNFFKFRYTKIFFDFLNESSSIHILVMYSFILFSLQATELILNKSQSFFQEKLALDVAYLINKFLIEKLQPLTITALESPTYRQDLNILQGSMGNVGQVINSVLNLLHNAVLISMYIYLIFQYTWIITVFLLIVSLPTAWYGIKKVQREHRYHQEASQIAMESSNLSGLLTHPYVQKELIVYEAREMLIGKWIKVTHANIKKRISFVLKEIKFSLPIEAITPLSYLVIQVVLLILFSNQRITLGDYIVINATAISLDVSLRSFWSQINAFKEIGIFRNRFQEFQKKYLPDHELISKKITIDSVNCISCNQLSFAYPGSQNAAIEQISLALASKGTVALVGENGSGKSTLSKILFGFHEISNGMLYINGIDINEINRLQLFKEISIVNQEYIRYPLTAYENIAMSEISIHEKSNVAKLMEQYPYLLPNQLDYNWVLGNEYLNARQLSGGQWQRIAIARALYKNSNILILDEATSELDPETETALIHDIIKNRQNKMTLLITHNLLNSSKSDHIIVLHEGKVIETGSHDQLIKQNGKYSKMWRSQQNEPEFIGVN